MQESVLVIPNIDEGGLEAWVEVLDATFVNAADHPTIGFAFDFEAVEGAVNEKRNALLKRL